MTVRRKSLLRVILGYVGVALLLTLPALGAPLSDPDAGTGERTVIYSMNTDKTTDANLVVNFINPADGSVESSVGTTVNPMGRAYVNSKSEVGASSWIGSAVVYSDKELATVARTWWTNGTAHDGVTQGTYTGFSQGATKVFLPNLFMRPWMYSTITVQNVGDTAADIQIAYYTRGQSSPFATRTFFGVPAGAHGYLDLKYANRSTDPSKVPSFPTQNWLGAAVVTSANDVTAVVTTHWDNYSGIYQGVPEGETDYSVYVPFVSKRRFAWWYSFTGILVQNTENTEATIHLELYDRDGNRDANIWDTLAPMSAKGYNTRYMGDAPGEPFYYLGPDSFDWLGSAVITSNTKIAVQVNNDWPGQMSGSSNNALAPVQGTTELFLPYMGKNFDGQWWPEFCGAIIQNLSDQANTVHLYVYGTGGGDPDWNDYTMHWSTTLDPWASYGTNTRYESGPGERWSNVPNVWQGTIYVVGDYDIGAVVNCQRNDSAFTYNGINK